MREFLAPGLRDALERAQSEALLDPLTGLKNRRAFERAVRELTRDNPVGMEGAALLLVDVDHFNRVNDTYGHLFPSQDQGQAAAQRIAAELLG